MRQTRLRYVAGAVAVAIVALAAVAALIRVRSGPGGAGGPGAGTDASAGVELFRDKGCAHCHHADSTDRKAGPGLQGLLSRETLPDSGWPATREYVRKQLLEPYDDMPSYSGRLGEEQIRLLLDYLEGL